MRGNHRLFGRNDLVLPAALTPEELRQIAMVSVRLREGTKTWFEAWCDGVLLGHVSTRLHGQVYRRPSDQGWVDASSYWHDGEPRHARAVLALLQVSAHKPTTTGPMSLRTEG